VEPFLNSPAKPKPSLTLFLEWDSLPPGLSVSLRAPPTPFETYGSWHQPLASSHILKLAPPPSCNKRCRGNGYSISPVDFFRRGLSYTYYFSVLSINPGVEGSTSFKHISPIFPSKLVPPSGLFFSFTHLIGVPVPLRLSYFRLTWSCL